MAFQALSDRTNAMGGGAYAAEKREEAHSVTDSDVELEQLRGVRPFSLSFPYPAPGLWTGLQPGLSCPSTPFSA